MILSGEVFSKQPNCGEMDIAVRDSTQHYGEISRQPRRGDPIVSHAFGKPESVGAVSEHRTAGLVAVQAPRIEFGQMPKQLGEAAVGAADQQLNALKQLSV
jgi:hypothetical protein